MVFKWTNDVEGLNTFQSLSFERVLKSVERDYSEEVTQMAH